MSIHLVGSGPQADGLDPAWDSFVSQARSRAGDQNRPIVVCLQLIPEDGGATAQDFLPVYAEPILARWPEATFEVVELRPSAAFLANPSFGSGTTEAPAAVQKEAAQTETAQTETAQPEAAQPEAAPIEVAQPTEVTPEPAFPDLNSAAAIIVGGGWTPGYLHNLIPHRDAISHAVRRGLPYLGFSAGASITSRHALIGGWHADGIQVQQEYAAEDLHDLTVADGLALISTLVQVHTDAWSNEGIVISALERNLCGHGVSIDEGTALVVDPSSGHTHRLGRGRLRWFSKEAHGVLVRTEEPPLSGLG